MAILLEKPREIARDHFLLRIKTDSGTPCAGQFINIRTTQGTDPLIRRPFSIFNYENGVLEIVIQLVGPGTKLLFASKAGPMDILGPLGKGFHHG